MASSLSLLSQIAANISANAAKLEEYLKTNNLPQPSFGLDAPLGYENLLKDPQVARARAALVNDGKKLQLLMLGPAEAGRVFGLNEIHLLGTLHTLCKFKVPQNVPIGGEITLEELSSKTGLSLDMLTRLVRLGVANYVFVEPRPGVIAHSARSKLLATDDGAAAHLEFSVTETMPSITKVAEALQKSPSGDLAPFELAFGDTFFGHKKKNPEKSALFAKVMAGTKGHNRGEEIANAFDWTGFNGTIVDVGGGVGHVATSIAKKYPNTRLVVEDLENLTDEANAYIVLEGTSSQVSFIGHDFFQPQPEQGKLAGVYFLSHIIHDWPDDKCRLILKHLVDAMRPDSRIVLCESILPTPGQLPEYQEALVRAQDLGMFSFLKARERTVEDLEALLRSVDSRLKVSRVIGPPEMKKNSLIEFAFDA